MIQNYLSDSLILVTARIGEKRSIIDLFLIIVFVFSTFGILYFRLQIWCQALQSLTTYLMLTTYSWMLCEGAYLRFILVFADYINTFRLLYVMDYHFLDIQILWNLQFILVNEFAKNIYIELCKFISLKVCQPLWGNISFRKIMIYTNRSKAR